MTQKEFTELTGLVPTPEEYKEIEAMYYVVPDMDKQEFCLRWRQTGKNPLTVGLAKQAQVLDGMLEVRNNELEDCQSRLEELACFLIGKADAYEDTDFYREAVKIIGQREVTLMKMRMDLPLWNEDKKYLISVLEGVR